MENQGVEDGDDWDMVEGDDAVHYGDDWDTVEAEGGHGTMGHWGSG